MTNIYAHISNGDAPKSQHVTEVSFVDENGKHVDIGGGGTAAGTLTEDNLGYKNNVPTSSINTTPVGVYKNSSGNLSVMFENGYGLSKQGLSGGIEALTVPAITALARISTLDSSAGLTDVINKVNEILNAVKNAH